MNWTNIDLHTHSPEVDDYRGNINTSPKQILTKSIEKNLDIIAITDHSVASYIKKVEAILEENQDIKDRIYIIPGTEIKINYQDEQIHLLIYFPPEIAEESFVELFNFSGVTESNKQGLNPENIILSVNPYQILEKVQSYNGFVVIAHADRKLSKLRNIDGKLLYNLSKSQTVLAVEIEKLESKKIINGRIKNLVFCSDSHALKEIGRRYSQILLPEISFKGLKEGLLFHKNDSQDILLI